MTTTRQDNAFSAVMFDNTMLDKAIDWIQVNLSPDDVFKQAALEYWAEANGYVRDE